ncbi:MAG TPA: hypothetical protein VNC78_03230 [Actinomycetota bacterium]|nr:hypothetical protein [Actinomycetota bacterium]
MLIDEVLPEPSHSERHETLVAGQRGEVYDALLHSNLAASPIVSVLVMARGTLWPLAARLKVGPPITVHSLEGMGFRILREDPQREIVLGLIGKFWTPTGALVRFDPDEFLDWNRPGHAVAAWNFSLEDASEGTLLSTETRIRTTDETAARRFRAYWTLVRPFSGAIRSEMLRTIKKTAESRATSP